MKATRKHPNNASRGAIAFLIVMLGAAMIVLGSGAASGNDRIQNDENPSRPRNPVRGHYAGDEAFTEPIETINVATPESGIIGKVNVKRGDVVQADDLLFELDMSVLEASRRLAQAKANTTAKLKAAQIEFEAKQKHYKKLVDLLAEEAGNPREVEKAESDAEVARQNIEAILEDNQQYALETKRIESQMELRRVRAPICGVVVDIRKKPGEYVSNSDPHLATIVQLDVLRVVFHLPTERAVKIQRGDSADVFLTETNQNANGIVEYVAPVTDAASGRVRVEVLIKNELGDYRSGVRCRIVETFSRQSMMDSPFDNR